MNAKGFLALGLATLLCVAAQASLGAQARTKAPLGPDGLLRVPPAARVTDPDHYLSSPDKSALDAKLANFEASKGSQLAIVMVATTVGEPIENFAHRVGDAWKLGRKGVGDGVLIVVAVQDRTTRIDVARNLEGAIPDVAASRVVRENMAPRFAAKDYAGGLAAGLDGLFALISAEGLPPGAGTSAINPAIDPAIGPVDRGAYARSGRNGEDRIRTVLPFLFIGALVGNALRRVLGSLGAMLAAGGAGLIASVILASTLAGVIVAVVVFVFSVFGAPMMFAMQVIGGRGPGASFGSGGFRSGGGGDFSGGGASGRW